MVFARNVLREWSSGIQIFFRVSFFAFMSPETTAEIVLRGSVSMNVRNLFIDSVRPRITFLKITVHCQLNIFKLKKV